MNADFHSSDEDDFEDDYEPEYDFYDIGTENETGYVRSPNEISPGEMPIFFTKNMQKWPN